MITDENKQQLMAEFSYFLDNLAENETVEPLNSYPGGIDLFTLCQEFIALKTEIKQESRQFKTALDSFRQVFNTLQQSHETLSSELAERRNMQQMETEQLQQTLLQPLLLELIELRDCLEISLIRSHLRHNRFMHLFSRRHIAFINSLYEGQRMMLRRLDRLLTQCEVQALTTLNQTFDPKSMQALVAEQDTEKDNGVVIRELRKGFKWKNKLLRPAEVAVNKLESDNYV